MYKRHSQKKEGLYIYWDFRPLGTPVLLTPQFPIMNQHIHNPLYTVEAVLWVGSHRISGVLSVLEDALSFRMNPDLQSHFSLYIPKKEIRRIEEFLVFGVSRNGLCIESQDGKEDRFVVEDSGEIKRLLSNWRRS